MQVLTSTTASKVHQSDPWLQLWRGSKCLYISNYLTMDTELGLQTRRPEKSVFRLVLFLILSFQYRRKTRRRAQWRRESFRKFTDWQNSRAASGQFRTGHRHAKTWFWAWPAFLLARRVVWSRLVALLFVRITRQNAARHAWTLCARHFLHFLSTWINSLEMN